MISVRTVVPLIVRPKTRSIIFIPHPRGSARVAPHPLPLPASAGRGRGPSRSGGRVRACPPPYRLALAALFLLDLARHLLDRAAGKVAELKRAVGQPDQPGDRIAE